MRYLVATAKSDGQTTDYRDCPKIQTAAAVVRMARHLGTNAADIWRRLRAGQPVETSFSLYTLHTED